MQLCLRALVPEAVWALTFCIRPSSAESAESIVQSPRLSMTGEALRPELPGPACRHSKSRAHSTPLYFCWQGFVRHIQTKLTVLRRGVMSCELYRRKGAHHEIGILLAGAWAPAPPHVCPAQMCIPPATRRRLQTWHCAAVYETHGCLTSAELSFDGC